MLRKDTSTKGRALPFLAREAGFFRMVENILFKPLRAAMAGGAVKSSGLGWWARARPCRTVAVDLCVYVCVGVGEAQVRLPWLWGRFVLQWRCRASSL